MTLICVISDTHTFHRQLYIPECDILIHCGDFTHTGKLEEIEDFVDWFSDQKQAKLKLYIAGNHELTLDPSHQMFNQAHERLVYSEKYEGHYLTSFFNARQYKLDVYGSPVSLEFGNWAFGRPESGITRLFNSCDILITHGPAHLQRDYVHSRGGEHTGSTALAAWIVQHKPVLHLFGHIHPSRGWSYNEGTWHVNASNVNDNYTHIHPPIMIQLSPENEVLEIYEHS